MSSRVLQKLAAPEWVEKLRDLRPSAQQAKEDVRQHLATSGSEKWDRFVQRAGESAEFVRQLSRHKEVSEKDALHAQSMRNLHLGTPAGTVESGKESGKTYQIKSLPGGQTGCTCNDWRFRGSVNPGYECKHIKAFKEGKTKVSSFKEQTSAFFDELAKIRAEQQRAADANFDSGGRPFSNLLTQEDEPMDYYPWRPAAPIDEPEVILGGYR